MELSKRFDGNLSREQKDRAQRCTRWHDINVDDHDLRGNDDENEFLDWVFSGPGWPPDYGAFKGVRGQLDPENRKKEHSDVCTRW